MEKWEMPTGFLMALAANPDAMRGFSSLSESEKEKIIEGVRSLKSRDEMRRFVASLAAEKK